MNWASLLAAVIAVTVQTTVSDAGTWTAPLTFRTVATPEGEHLAAEFDLGVQLRRIDKAEVTLTLPDGFSGGVAATSNSVYRNSLAIAVGAADGSGVVPSLLSPGDSSWLGDGWVAPLSAESFAVAAGEPITAQVAGRPRGYAALETLISDDAFLANDAFPAQERSDDSGLVLSWPPTRWPDSLFDGRGQVGIAHFSSASTRWLQPDGSWLPGRSSRDLRLPTSPVIDASVTITGIAVPEPGAGLVAAVLLLTATARRGGVA